MTTPDMLTCARCGQAKPLADFDRRFIGKPVRLTCAACRGVTDEQHKWEHAWEQRHALEAQWAQRLGFASVTLMQEWEREQETRHREHAARRRKEERLLHNLATRGFTEVEQQAVLHAVRDLRACGRPWADIKRDFLALDPPYLGDPATYRARRQQNRVRKMAREHIYAQQDGRCYYCQCELLPLSAWREDTADGRRPNHVSSGLRDKLPEIDHKTPLSRGGVSTDDNLCYACNRCNARKMVRTEAEFRAYPDDAISYLGLWPGQIDWMLSIEDRYSWEDRAP